MPTDKLEKFSKPELDGVRFIELPSSYPNQAQQQLSLVEFWRVLRKRRSVLVACVVATVLMVGIVTLIVPRKYDAVARLALDFENSDALGLEQLGISTGLDATTKLETQIRVIQSDSLAAAVMDDLKLQSNHDFAGKLTAPSGRMFSSLDANAKSKLLKQFHASLSVQLVPKTQIVEIRVRNRNPKLATDIANDLANAYIERNFKTKYEATMQASDWLSKQLDDLKMRVEDSQQKLGEYQKKTGILGTDESHNIIMEKLDELNKQLSAAEGDRIIKEAKFRIAKSGNPELMANIVPESTIAILRKQQAELKAQYAQLNAKFGPNYPRLIQVQSQLEDVQGAITHEVKNLGERIEDEYKAAAKSEQMLRAAMDEQKQQAYKLNEDAVQYAILQRDVQSSRELYEGLLKKLKEAGIVAGLKSSNVSIVDQAAIPVDPATPNIPLNMSLALMGGLLGGVAMAFIVENVDSSIRTPDDVEIRCSLPSLGIIPTIATNGRSNAKLLPGTSDAKPSFTLPITLEKPKSETAEAFRALRTSILLASVGTPPKVIVVTSALPREGKSTTAMNSAIVLAQTGQKVLLVDADMRRPTVHSQLGLGMNAGLSACLAGVEDPGEVAIPVPTLPNLHVLPSGRTPPYPSEMLASESMRQLLERWSTEFDHVVIDTPPVLAVTDAVVLSACSDAVILVARSAHTGHQSLRRARDLLRKVNANIAGVVVNDLSLNSVGYQEYYGHYGSETGYYYHDHDA